MRRRIASLAHMVLTVALAGFATHAHAAQGRLGHEVVPTFESIRLVVDAARKDYTGSVEIQLAVREATSSFRLHARDMTIRRVGLRSGRAPVAVTHRADSAGVLVLEASKPLEPGAHTLTIDFANDFDTRAGSLYRVESEGESYTFTQFEPNQARAAFPCWDEPEFKIPFQVSLVVPKAHVAVSNTPILRETVTGAQKTVVFKPTAPLPTYLLAMATGPLERVLIPGMSVPGGVVTPRGKTRLADEAVRITPPILAALEQYFGSRYPYEKLDLIAVPEFAAGAMENPGAITYRDGLLLVDPATASLGQRLGLAATTAHELAHIWFGDLVTLQWWDDLWLNESFATWMGSRITNEVFPQYNLPVLDVPDRESPMGTDARLSTNAVRKPVGAADNLDRLFDELAYQKGRSVLGMLETWLGPETFRRGVLDYLRAHEWKNAEGTDFWTALSAASGRDVGVVASAFLDQEGVPLVRAEVLPDGKVRLRQQRFLNYGLQAPKPLKWKIPVTLKYSDGRNTFTQSVLLESDEQMVTLESSRAPAWIHPNAGERGYYRWWVPAPMMKRLAESAASSLDARERVGFLGNAGALLDAGELPGGEWANLLTLFANDPQPEVISAVIGGVYTIHDAFLTPDLKVTFATYVQQTLGPALRRFGLEKTAGEGEAVSLMRPGLLYALGAHGNDAAVLAHARGLAQAYLKDPSTMDATLAGTALSLTARHGDAALFEELKGRFESTRIPGERGRYLSALGSFRSPALIERALDYALQGPLRPQEIFTVPRNVAENEELKDRTWRWFTENYAAIVSRIPEFYVPSLPYTASGCSAKRLEAARTFFAAPEHSPPGTREEFARMADGVSDCVSLREREGRAVAQYLNQQAAPK